MFNAQRLILSSYSGSMSGDDAVYSATETTVLDVMGCAEDVGYKKLLGQDSKEPIADYKFFFSESDKSQITTALIRAKGTLTFEGQEIAVEVMGIDFLNTCLSLKNIGGAS